MRNLTKVLACCALALAIMLSSLPDAFAQKKLVYYSFLGSFEFWHGWLNEMEKRFEASHPGVDFVRNDVAFDQSTNQYTVAHLGGNPPDIYHPSPGGMLALQAIGALEPLETLIPKSYWDQVPEGLKQSMTVKGHIYGVEWFPGPILMYYNRNLLKQAGLNPDQPPQTWPEFEDAVMKICKLPKQGEAKIYGFALRSQRVPNSGQWAIPIIYGFGGDLTTDGEVKLDTPPTRRAMQFLQNAAKGGCVPEGISTADTRALFAKGQAGFIFEGPWGQGNFLRLSDNKMKVAPNGDAWVADMPKGPDGKRRTIANANVVSISSKSKEKQLAAEWMQWVTSDPAVVDMVFEATQLISSPRSDRMTSGLMGKDAHTQVFRGGMAYSNDIPLADARFEGIMGEFIPAIQNIMKGADIAAELAQADRRIQRITSR